MPTEPCRIQTFKDYTEVNEPAKKKKKKKLKRNKETQENSVECGITEDTRRKAFGMRDADWSRVCSLWRTSLVRTEVCSVDSVS